MRLPKVHIPSILHYMRPMSISETNASLITREKQSRETYRTLLAPDNLRKLTKENPAGTLKPAENVTSKSFDLSPLAFRQEFVSDVLRRCRSKPLSSTSRPVGAEKNDAPLGQYALWSQTVDMSLHVTWLLHPACAGEVLQDSWPFPREPRAKAGLSALSLRNPVWRRVAGLKDPSVHTLIFIDSKEDSKGRFTAPPSTFQLLVQCRFTFPKFQIVCLLDFHHRKPVDTRFIQWIKLAKLIHADCWHQHLQRVLLRHCDLNVLCGRTHGMEQACRLLESELYRSHSRKPVQLRRPWRLSHSYMYLPRVHSNG